MRRAVNNQYYIYEAGADMTMLSPGLLYCLKNLPLPLAIQGIQPIYKGYSSEQKYFIPGLSGQDYLLRIRKPGGEEAQQQEARFILQLHDKGLPVPRVYACQSLPEEEGSFMLLSYLPGIDMEAALPGLPASLQADLGKQAGQVLAAIHQTKPWESLPKPRLMIDKVHRNLGRIQEAGLSLPHQQQVLDFIRDKLSVFGREPLVCQHGDYHPGNMIYSPQGGLGIIDFNRWEVGERAEEFVRLQSFTIESSIPFARGQLNGYFDGPAPADFWQALAVHVALTSLYSIVWAIPFGDKEVAGMVQRYLKAYEDYGGYARLVPRWYTDGNEYIS